MPPPVRRPRRWGRWVAGGLGLILFCCVGGLGGAATLATLGGVLDRHAAWSASAVDAIPDANATEEQWAAWADRAIRATVKKQGDALLQGDEAGFLAAVDPSATGLLAEHKKRYRVLRAMGLGVWDEATTGSAVNAGGQSWSISLRFHYCFGSASCDVVEMETGSQWQLKNDRIVLTALAHSDVKWSGPRPWEVDDLTVATGDRVVVAATKVNAWRLPGAVKAADRAAAAADTFAKWHDAPSRYVIFLAGPDDWKDWYGYEQPEWAAAWAVPVDDYATEVVVRTESVRQSELEGLLTHELTHVTTLAGPNKGASSGSWWLIEGIAEYAEYQDLPVRQYDAYIPTRDFVRSRWNGDPAVSAPTASASLNEAGARYGISYLSIRRIAEKYGPDKMLEFWGAVVHDGDSLDAAARAKLGATWAVVKADCVKYIRGSLR